MYVPTCPALLITCAGLAHTEMVAGEAGVAMGSSAVTDSQFPPNCVLADTSKLRVPLPWLLTSTNWHDPPLAPCTKEKLSWPVGKLKTGATVGGGGSTCTITGTVWVVGFVLVAFTVIAPV